MNDIAAWNLFFIFIRFNSSCPHR